MPSTEPQTPADLARQYGYKEYMVERYVEMLGMEETIQLLEANDRPLPVTIRTNTIKITPKTLQKRLVSKGFQITPVADLPYAFEVDGGDYPIGATHEYLFGYYFVQGIASMVPVEVLDPHAGEVVVDMCASPGGKATHLAQNMNNKGRLYALEVNSERMAALTANLARCGVRNALVLNIDAKQFPAYGIQVDKVLLDAPCTGEGTIRSDPSRKQSRELDDVQFMSATQKDLLAAAIKIVKPGGTIVYSTCAVAPEENEMVVQWALKYHPDVIIADAPRILNARPGVGENPGLQAALRFYPHVHNTEGFFVCKLTKAGNRPSQKPKQTSPRRAGNTRGR
ncbi:MAG TPA: RsmB/NOP family class I SAM-dependent RNA methyltransferase [Candidatus Lokiarchaeia archaeon]|nr:RsmB/NOP family class I SAM-dependent RNA methyltransferase [Candidatus Lokiarchaeia archaeon]